MLIMTITAVTILGTAIAADKMTVATYSGTFTFAELDNLTGVRRASLELLQKMGVELTEKARQELAGAARLKETEEAYSGRSSSLAICVTDKPSLTDSIIIGARQDGAPDFGFV
jgi:hypothetical protein